MKHTGPYIAEYRNKKRPNNKFRATGVVQFDNGTTKSIQTYGSTKKEAREKFHLKLKQLSNLPTHETITVSEVFDKLIEQKIVFGLKVATIDIYQYNFNSYINPFIGHRPISEIKYLELENIVSNLVVDGNYWTAEKVRELLKQIWRFGIKIYISDNDVAIKDIASALAPVPTKNRKKKSIPDRRTWNLEVVESFLKHLKIDYSIRLDRNFFPYFLLMVCTGARGGELRGLLKTDLRTKEFNGNTVYYVNIDKQISTSNNKDYLDTPKSKASIRIVPITKAIYMVMQQHILKTSIDFKKSKVYKPNTKGYLFTTLTGNHLKERNTSRRMESVKRKLYLPHTSPHKLRSFYATHITQKITSLGYEPAKLRQKLLGHEHGDDISDVSHEVYLDVIDTQFWDSTIDLFDKL